jgi:hypothetical protein
MPLKPKPDYYHLSETRASVIVWRQALSLLAQTIQEHHGTKGLRSGGDASQHK